MRAIDIGRLVVFHPWKAHAGRPAPDRGRRRRFGFIVDPSLVSAVIPPGLNSLGSRRKEAAAPAALGGAIDAAAEVLPGSDILNALIQRAGPAAPKNERGAEDLVEDERLADAAGVAQGSANLQRAGPTRIE